MLLKNLTKVWISKYDEINDHGEKTKKWIYKGTAYLNLQQDISEIDRNSSGEVDYSIENARTDINYDIRKGNGVSLTDVSKLDSFIPEYKVTDNPKIGSTTLYKLEKYNGD